MNYHLIDWFSYSIALPALLALAKFKYLGRTYAPFLLLLCLAMVNEGVNSYLIANGHSNAVSTNIFVLVDSALLLWFLHRCGTRILSRKLLLILLSLFLIAWTTEIISRSITLFISYFVVGYSLIIVLLSISRINELIIWEKTSLLRNPQYLIMTGFIIFYTYNALVEIFWIYGLNGGDQFRLQVYRILAWINLAVNLIFAVAILWIPRKREYSLL